MKKMFLCLGLSTLTFFSFFSCQNHDQQKVALEQSKRKENNSLTALKTDTIDVAIIGCGVSGTYCGAKIAQKYPEKKIKLFDVANQIGGRLLSIRLPGLPHLPVELGGMRFSASHHKVEHLVEHLRLPTHPFSGKTKEGMLYLRGVHLKESNLVDPKLLPYHLAANEEGKSPYQILMHAVKSAFPEIENLSYEEWLKKRDTFQWKGKPLEQVSWQQFLAENISDEAFQLFVDLGYVQLVAEVSMYTQLSGFLEKSEGPPHAISTGYQSLPEKLAEIARQKGAEIELESKLISVNQTENGVYRLVFEQANGARKSVHAKSIISTLTPPALLRLWDTSPTLQGLVARETLDQFWTNPLTKLFFAYHNPWWRELDLYDGSSTTTLPLRSCFYFGTEAESYEGDKGNNNALLLASYQGAFPLFWQTSAERNALTHASNHYSPDNEAIWFGQYFLKKLHGLEDIPAPYAAAFMSWDRPPHFGAYFFWKVGVKPERWYEENCELGAKSAFFVVGSAYSTRPGWVEGALETCDKCLMRYFQIDESDKLMFE